MAQIITSWRRASRAPTKRSPRSSFSSLDRIYSDPAGLAHEIVSDIEARIEKRAATLQRYAERAGDKPEQENKSKKAA